METLKKEFAVNYSRMNSQDSLAIISLKFIRKHEKHPTFVVFITNNLELYGAAAMTRNVIPGTLSDLIDCERLMQ